VGDLCEILRSEMQSGAPSPAPSWYVFSSISMGPRKIGYSSCSNRECMITESLTRAPFKKCAQCKVSWYCSDKCQGSDWVARHKMVCVEAAEFRKTCEFAGAFFQKLSVASLTGDLPRTGSNSFSSIMASLNAPDVVSRTSQRRSDLKKEKRKKVTSSWYTPTSTISSSPSVFCSKTADNAQGLVSRTDLNGQRCIIIGPFSEASGRWPVRFG
jgi:hypothetical protein